MIYLYCIRNKYSKEYMTPTLDFFSDVSCAKFFWDYEVALAYCGSLCEIVKFCLTEVENEKENG